MKTLDEVIEELEDEGLFADALHYLRAYRENQQAYVENSQKAEEARERYLEAVKNCEHVCLKAEKVVMDAERNDPITWEELRQMEGKPVWVELNSKYGNYSHWGIIHSFPKAGYEFMELWGFHDIVSFSVMQKEQGKTWNAYRKERE